MFPTKNSFPTRLLSLTFFVTMFLLKFKGGIFFFDIGTSSKNFKSIDFSHNIFGYGIGLKFFVSSIGPISISVGFNPYGQQHLHLMDAQ